MSDQRMERQRNQVAEAPKDHGNEHGDFDSCRSQHHKGYCTPISTSMASDPYTMSNYGDGTRSNGGDPMTFLGGSRGQMLHDLYSMEGFFGSGGGGFGGAFAQPTAPATGFNYFHVAEAPKDHGNEHGDFDSCRSQHHKGYCTPISTSMASDPYTMSNYGDGTRSNGGDPMTFLGGSRGQMLHDLYSMDGFFGSGGGGFGGAFAQPTAPATGFNYFHVAEAPKDHGNEHGDFDSCRSQHNKGYCTPISTSMASDPYTMSNYGDGTRSNGRDPMTFLGGYGGQMGHDSYGMEGIFGSGGGGFGGAFAQPTAPAAGFNYFHGNGEYSLWGSSAAMSRKPHDENFYRGSDGGMHSAVDTLKGVKQGMQALRLSDPNVKVMDGKVEGKDNLNVQQTQSAAKKVTYASIASQPAKPTPQVGSGGMKKKDLGMPPPNMVPGKHNMDFQYGPPIGTWEGENGGATIGVKPIGPPPPQVRPAWGRSIHGAGPRAAEPNDFPPGPTPPHHHPHQVAILAPPHHHHPPQGPMIAGPPPHQIAQVPPPPRQPGPLPLSQPVLYELLGKNNYNPVEFNLTAKGARFFVIKSYYEESIFHSIKMNIWSSTEHGNQRLDQAYREREGKGMVYLFFSVNGSGHFCGMAKMTSPVDYNASSSVWSQVKWKGLFKVRWIYVKDVPNAQLRHIKLENNENNPVTKSRNGQEVPFKKGKQVLKVMHEFRHSTSVFDDFVHYEKQQEEKDAEDRPQQNSQHHHKGS